MKFSLIIPVYNRPDEIKELLESLELQTYKNFEVVVVEDGSTLKCEEICNKFDKSLNLRYFFKPNSGQGFTRNYAFERATGDYLIVFDSDCIIYKPFMIPYKRTGWMPLVVRTVRMSRLPIYKKRFPIL